MSASLHSKKKKKKSRDLLVAWLRDAHAMEEAAADNLDRLEDSVARLPHLAPQFGLHRDESRAQADRIASALHTLGADTSVIKDVARRMLARAEAYAAAVAEDQLVKGFLAAYAFESFEIASYVALGTAARSLDEHEIEQMCAAHLQRERAMAHWLEEHLAEVTEDHLRP